MNANHKLTRKKFGADIGHTLKMDGKQREDNSFRKSKLIRAFHRTKEHDASTDIDDHDHGETSPPQRKNPSLGLER